MIALACFCGLTLDRWMDGFLRAVLDVFLECDMVFPGQTSVCRVEDVYRWTFSTRAYMPSDISKFIGCHPIAKPKRYWPL